tara:strand:- start:31 stop:1005 length:975 start_codon:yes stop_codon:yes gene_type:complete
VKRANHRAVSYSGHSDVPLSNRKGSEMRMKTVVLDHVQGNLEKFMKHFTIWMDLYHEAYPDIKTNHNATGIYGNLLLVGLTNNDITMLQNKLIPTERDMHTKLVSELYVKKQCDNTWERHYELEDDDLRCYLRDRASFWMSAETSGISGNCYNEAFIAWRNESKIHAGDWTFFFAEVSKSKMNRDTFLKYARDEDKRDTIWDEPLNYKSVGDAIVDFLRLGKMAYDSLLITCDIKHSDKCSQIEKYRQEMQSNISDVELKCKVNRHMIKLKDMLSNNYTTFANLIVSDPIQPILKILFCSDDGNARDIAFESADDFYILTFFTS